MKSELFFIISKNTKKLGIICLRHLDFVAFKVRRANKVQHLRLFP